MGRQMENELMFQNPLDSDAFVSFKKKTIRLILLFFALFGFVPILTTYIHSRSLGLQGFSYAIILIYTIFLLVYFLGKNISIYSQTQILIYGFIAIGVIGLFSFGITHVAPVFFLTALMLAALFLNLRQSLLIFFLVITSIVIAMALFITQRLVIPIDYVIYNASIETWVSRITTLISFMLFVLFIIERLRSFLEKNIQNIEHQHQQLMDINERLTASQEELRTQYELLEVYDKDHYRLAFFDSLTALPNREFFMKTLNKTIDELHDHDEVLALIQLDIANFSQINQVMGHSTGDKILVNIARRIESTYPHALLIGRIGGDEFVVLLQEKLTQKDFGRHMQRLVEVIKEPFDLGHFKTRVEVHIGGALYPTQASNAQELIQHTNLAMNQAEKNNSRRPVMFDSRMQESLEDRYLMMNNLRLAKEKGELVLFYQNMFFSNNLRLRGFEVLARWKRSGYGYVSPLEFIPLLEESGLIVEYGYWIIEEAFKQLNTWKRETGQQLLGSINISPIQLRQYNFIERLVEILEATNTSPDSIEIEITESVFIDDLSYVISVLERMRDLGLRLALDDFGTGYSSLSYLRQLPINTLKIDRSFINAIEDEEDSCGLVSSMIQMAHAMDIEVVAEGIETEYQADFLKKNGCDIFQGYLYHRPEPASDIVFHKSL